jgi:hypothetical protein
MTLGLVSAQNIGLQLGRVVVTVFDAWQYAGEHAMQFDASNLPAGIYRCRIETDGADVMTLLTVHR